MQQNVTARFFPKPLASFKGPLLGGEGKGERKGRGRKGRRRRR